ncbi:MAG: Tn7 transposase TnsA N-terminal domain-containing protein [Acetatifactor sp.]|nr:Tn7 transposase TnsA N-terminal domain-containing protein [Acetatifactor sp.]
MKPKGYKRTRCEKRSMSKCADGVARTYNAIESKYAEMLQENPDIKEFRCQVLLEGLEIGEYCSDFVATKVDGELRVRECVYRKDLSKLKTAKLLDASRNYWRRRGVTDWGIVVEKKENAEGGVANQVKREQEK